MPRPKDATAVEAVYSRLARFYDVIYGVTLEPGRRRAMTRLDPRPGETILEIGVGTGLSAVQYPPGCRVVAIDLSEAMLARARSRLTRKGVEHVALCRMDAARLAFGDAEFDAVYAPYVMNVVADPVHVAREMTRVCRPDGRIVILNHFEHAESRSRGLVRWLGRLAWHAGVNWNVNLYSFLRDAGLTALSVDRVNVPRVSSVVVCRKA